VSGYPLEAALRLRQQEVEQAELALRDAIAAEEGAAKALAKARGVRQAHALECAALAAKEALRNASGRKAAQILRAQAFLQRVREEGEALGRQVERAKEASEASAAERERAREALAQARAEREALLEHHSRWLETKRRAQEARAEEEIEDLVAARHRPRSER